MSPSLDWMLIKIHSEALTISDFLLLRLSYSADNLKTYHVTVYLASV